MRDILQKLRGIITDPQHKRMYEVGAMASIASHIEHVIELILTGLIETDQRYGGAVIRWVSVQQQIILIKKILKDRYGKESDAYKEWSRAINQLSKSIDDRNEILHSTYRHTDDDKTFVQSFKRGQFESTVSELDVEGIEAKVDLAYDRLTHLANLAVKHDLPFPDASLGKLPPETQEDSRTEDQNQDTQPPPPQSSQE